MKVKDLKPREGNVDIVVDVIDVGVPREFNKFGKAGRVSTAIAKDETGNIKLTLWNEDIERINAGDKIHLTNGYVNEWQGEMQLTTGRMGKLEVVGKADTGVSKEPAAETDTYIAEKETYKKDVLEEELNVDEEEIKDPDEEVI